MINKKISIAFLGSFILMYSCSKSIYVYEAPQKATYVKMEYSSERIIPIDPNDTVAINEKSITNIFTIIDIKKEKGVYTIIVESDSLRTIYNSKTDNNFSYHPSYQIVSLKTESIKKHKKIKKGKQYKLTLNPCFEPDTKIYMTNSRIYLVYVYLKGMRISVYKSTLDIYTTPNLDGLYYIESNESDSTSP